MKRQVGIIFLITLALVSCAQDSAQIYYGFGKEDIKNKNWLEAISHLNQSIEFNPSDSAYHKRAIAKMRSHDNEGSLFDINMAIQLRPNKAEYYLSRGNIHSFSKSYIKAIEDVSIAIKLDSSFWSAYINRGIYKRIMKEYDGAIYDFTTAIKIMPATSAYWERGMTEFAKKDYKGALNDYFTCIKLDSCSLSAFYEVGEVYHKSGNDTKAIEYYNKGLDLEPNTGYLYTARGRSEIALGLKKEGCDDLKKALRLKDESAPDFIARLCK